MPITSRPTQILLILLISVSSALIFYNTEDTSMELTNPGSRYATVEALIDHGTYFIDETPYYKQKRMDMVKIGNHYYSSKPPLLPTFTAGIYWFYKNTTGKNLKSHPKDVVRFCNRVVIGIPYVLLLIYISRLISLLVNRDEAVLATMLIACFAYTGFGYGRTLNNHIPAAAAALIGFYYACYLRRGPEVKTKHWCLSGICCGILPTLDLPSLLISLAIMIYLMTFNFRKTISLFLPIALIPLVIHIGLTYLATESILPIYLRKSVYYYEGGHWLVNYYFRQEGKEPKYIYLFHMLIGHHGIFSMNPALIFGSVAIWKIIKKRSKLLAEALVVGCSAIVLIILYTFKTSDYGGSCIGFRWLIVIMPLIIIFWGVWIEQCLINQWSKTGLYLIISIVFLIGLINIKGAFDTPWKDSLWHTFLVENMDKIRIER